MRKRSGILKSLVLGLLASVLLTLGAMLLMAAALIGFGVSDSAVTLLNQLVKYLSIAVGVCIAVPRGGSRGLASGVLIALAYVSCGYALCTTLGGGSFRAGNMLGEMLLGSAVGAVTGAVRANMRSRRGAARS